MKTLLLAATVFFVASAKLQATEALMFYGGDYTLYILIGRGDKSRVADVRITVPGGKDLVHVPSEHLKIKKFDDDKQVLVMSYTNTKNDPEAPPSFTFSAKKKTAVLTIKGKTFRSSFDWLDE